MISLYSTRRKCFKLHLRKNLDDGNRCNFLASSYTTVHSYTKSRKTNFAQCDISKNIFSVSSCPPILASSCTTKRSLPQQLVSFFCCLKTHPLVLPHSFYPDLSCWQLLFSSFELKSPVFLPLLFLASPLLWPYAQFKWHPE